MVQRRVVSVSPFVQPELLGKKRTLVPRRRIIAYRLRRNRGRIKLYSKKRKNGRKTNENAGLVLVHCFNRDGDKTIPSTNVTNFRSYGVSILPFPRPTSLKLLSPIDKHRAAADQSARRAGFHVLWRQSASRLILGRRRGLAHGFNEARRAHKENRRTLSSFANGMRELSFVLVC